MRALPLAVFIIASLGAAAPAFAAEQARELRGTGVQIYDCAAQGGGYAWQLKGPDARLLDSAGAEFGHQFAGPTWQAKDGSAVVGEAIVSDPAPTQGAIPWLLLRAKSHEGSGAFASVSYVAPIQTEGGAAPTSGCDQAHAGTESRVPYNAIYVFFSQP